MARIEKTRNGRWRARFETGDGERHSLGTFDTQEEARAAAERAEDPTSQVTLRDYFYGEWLKEPHVMRRTQIEYAKTFKNHIEEPLGDLYTDLITTRTIREVVKPYIACGKNHLAHKIKAVLGSIYRALIDADRAERNPAHGMRIPQASSDPFRALSSEDFRKITTHLQDTPKLFALFLVGTGMRFGEATEIRVKDFDGAEILVRRRVTKVGYEHSATRVLVEEATKSGHKRVVPVSPMLAEALRAHIAEHQLGQEDLLFSSRMFIRHMDLREAPEMKTRYIDAAGKVRWHGTETSYVASKCRCDDCRAAAAAAKRRRRGLPPAVHSKATHLQTEDWRRIWTRAVKKAGLSWVPRTHDLRHSHATILVESGVDIYEIKSRLGHQSIETTQLYLHRSKQRAKAAATASDVFF